MTVKMPPYMRQRGISRTADDEVLARQRYEEYGRLCRTMPNASFAEKLALLPLAGGTPLECGCTRFEHVQYDKCRRDGEEGV